MATSSITHNFIITDPEVADRLAKALEESANGPPRPCTVRLQISERPRRAQGVYGKENGHDRGKGKRRKEGIAMTKGKFSIVNIRNYSDNKMPGMDGADLKQAVSDFSSIDRQLVWSY